MSFHVPLTVEQLAEKLQCSPYTVREHAKTGRLPGIKFGDDWVFPPEALNQALTQIALAQAHERSVGKKASVGVVAKERGATKRTAIPAAWRG